MTTERVALVTGASRGIGRATAVALAREQTHVILVARAHDELETIAREIRANGGGATVFPLDLRDFAKIDLLAQEIGAQWGRLDALLGNAGIKGPHKTVATLDPAALTEAIDVNAISNFRLIRAFDPLLRRSPAGRVVFVSSNCAVYHLPEVVCYQASKAALESIVLTYATECKDTAIRVNIFRPGGTRTDMAVKWFRGSDEYLTLKAPEEVAPQIVALLRPDCTQTGEVIFYPGTEPAIAAQ